MWYYIHVVLILYINFVYNAQIQNCGEIMYSGFLSIEQILDIDKWQLLQDSLAQVTKLAIITVDYKGVPVTRHSARRPFCQYVRGDVEMEKFCHKCDARGGLEAVRLGTPYIYLCHCDIVDLAIPIMINGQYIGAVLAGQVRLPESEQNKELEKILYSPSKALFITQELNSMYEALPTLPYNDIQQVAEMLFNLCSYLVQEAINKNLLAEMVGQLGGRTAPNVSLDPFTGYPIGSIEYAKKTMSSAMMRSYINTNEDEQPKCKNPVLKPALDYIYANKSESITQTQMSSLCHISTSHFSRLFAQEIGEGFSAFLARQKVEWSKQLLEKTTLSVNQVSDELGFSSPGYYIKTFKRYENLTPAIYRKYYRERR